MQPSDWADPSGTKSLGAGVTDSQWPDSDGMSASLSAYRFLEARIRGAYYLPGRRLVAEEIAKELHMSRMPVREAFRRLATEGLITLRANRGAVVTELGREEIREIFLMRAALESLAAAQAVQRLNAQHFAELEQRLARMEQAQHDPQQWVTLHYEFHDYLSSISGLPRLRKMVFQLHNLIEPCMRVWMGQSHNLLEAKICHEQLMEALRSGDAVRVEAEVRRHVLSTGI